KENYGADSLIGVSKRREERSIPSPPFEEQIEKRKEEKRTEKMSLHRRLRRAQEENESELEDRDIVDPDEYRSPLFEFVRRVMAEPEFQGLGPHKALSIIETWLEELGYEDAQDSWAEEFGIDEVDARAEFIDLWQSIRFAHGQDPLETALRLATAYPVA